MGTNVNLTPELERFAQGCVASGRFNNVSEVVRSALRMLQEAEERRAAFVASLEAAREEGLREGLATVEEVEAEIRAAIDVVRTRRFSLLSPAAGALAGAPPGRRSWPGVLQLVVGFGFVRAFCQWVSIGGGPDGPDYAEEIPG
jgi:antitoxin ParD1/3/4